MGRRYAACGQRACAASAPETILGVTSTSAIRPRIYEAMMGASGSPADNAILWSMQRYTAAGTATSVTPGAIDSGDPAATATAGKNHTSDPTYTSNTILFNLALNQRASHRWVAAPGGEIVLPAAASNGVGLYPYHASYTGNCDSHLHWEE